MNLDIIIPTFNESNNLRSLLPYLNDTINNEGINIFVLDAFDSDDDTATVCQQHNINFYKSQSTQRSKQLNEGASLSDGDALVFLHADVIPPKNFIQSIKDTLQADYKFGLFAYKFDKDKWYLNANAFFTKFGGIFCGGGDQIHFMTREVFTELGGYSNEHCIMEDFNFFDKIKEAKIKYKILPSKATVSSRKYTRYSYVRVNIVNLLAFAKYKMNVPSQDIKHFYHRWLN